MSVRWIVDGNNVFGSRPDGWWNDRGAAMRRFTQRVAEWCHTHADDVTLVFDGPVPSATIELSGGNLTIVEAPRRGRGAADDHIVRLADEHLDSHPEIELTVVTSDTGLRKRLPEAVTVIGSGRFSEIVRY
jgi:predicted RNA-binding protein with PIN domain